MSKPAKMSIWKYVFQINDKVEIEMPEGAQFLSVHPQGNQLCLWAYVPVEGKLVKRHLLIRGTGHDATNVGRFIGTFQIWGGDFIFHAFEDPTDV